jgi:hypothetical protein
VRAKSPGRRGEARRRRPLMRSLRRRPRDRAAAGRCRARAPTASTSATGTRSRAGDRSGRLRHSRRPTTTPTRASG